jgi:hypothetical protein
MTLPELYVAFAVVLVLWSGLLWIAGRLAPGRERAQARPLAIALGAVALGLTLLPLGDFTLWRWVMSAHANPSVLFVGFLAAYVGTRLSGRVWLSLGERRTAYVLGFAIGLVLYVSATGFFGPDLYAAAWESRLVVVVTGALAAALIVSGNRVGILLLAALGASMGDVLESDNVWDYLIDPAFWFLSVGGLLRDGLVRFRRDRANGGGSPDASAAVDEVGTGPDARQDLARS